MENDPISYEFAIKQEPFLSSESVRESLHLSEIKQEVLDLYGDEQAIDHEKNFLDLNIKRSEIVQENVYVNTENEQMISVIIKEPNSKTQREIIYLKENPVINATTERKPATFRNDQHKSSPETVQLNPAMHDHTYYALFPITKYQRKARRAAILELYKKEDFKDLQGAKVL